MKSCTRFAMLIVVVAWPFSISQAAERADASAFESPPLPESTETSLSVPTERSAGPGGLPSCEIAPVERHQQLLVQNAALSQALQESQAALEQQRQLAQAFKQVQDKSVTELHAARQASAQLQTRLEATQHDLQQLQQQNLELALAMADEREHSKAVNEQSALLLQQNQQLRQHLGALVQGVAQAPAALSKVALSHVSPGEHLRLTQPTLFTSEIDGKTSTQMLPAGSGVTVIASPQAGSGVYAVSTEQGTLGWISLRR